MKRILMIDDDYGTARLVEVILRNEEFEFDSCINPQTAIIKASRQHYDAILVDHLMPNITGIELIKVLHEKTESPIYMISNCSETDVMNKAKEEGLTIKGFIPKADLVESVKKVLEDGL